MLPELLAFLLASCVILLPGIALAMSLGIGRTTTDRLTYGCTLGLSLAVYLAVLASQWHLSLFYPVWVCIFVIAIASYFIKRKPAQANSVAKPLLLVLLVVAGTRFALTLVHALPMGFDPTSHLLLSWKIQATGHTIHDWLPFENVPVNYPLGSHILVVVLSRISRLSLDASFKFLMQLVGLITTAQMFTFARAASRDERLAVLAAAIYGLLAWFGSLSYFDWGGLPNELGMLCLLGALSLWIDDDSHHRPIGIVIMLAAVPLIHHHVMLVAIALIAVAMLLHFVRIYRVPPALLLAPFVAILADLFFLIPFALKARELATTRVLQRGEDAIALQTVPGLLGCALCILAVIGLLLWLIRKFKLNALIPASLATLLILFALTEYAWPYWLELHHKPPSTALAPSRFVTDLNYFLPIFAGGALCVFCSHRRTWLLLLIVFTLSATEFHHWRRLFSTRFDTSPGFIRACAWVDQHTPAKTLVLNDQPWTCYLTKRPAAFTSLPFSEANVDFQARINHANDIIEHRVPPDPAYEKIVAILTPDQPRRPGLHVLYVDPLSQTTVVELWP